MAHLEETRSLAKQITIHEVYINRIAWGFHKTTGLDYEDLKAQAYYIICRAWHTYKPEKYTVLSFIKFVVSMELRDYIKKQYPHSKMNMKSAGPYTDKLDQATQPEQVYFDFIEAFQQHKNPAVRSLIQICLDHNKKTPLTRTGLLMKKMKSLGYSVKEITQSYQQVKIMLQEA